MTALVLDASATAPLFLNDVASDLLPGLINALASDGAIVPAHWSLEVANLIRIARRRDRIDDAGRDDAIGMIRSLIVEDEPPNLDRLFGDVWRLAEGYGLTIYDAIYLELACRRRLPLASNDAQLLRAADAESVPLFGR